MKRFFAFFLFLAVSFSVPSVFTAMAQNVVSGDISGVVTDPTGAAVPGAAVTATFTATGGVKKATTGATGTYRISLLTPGTYHLTFAGKGFNTAETDVVVNAGVVAEGDAKLQLGSNNVTVEVTEASPLLQTENAEITTEFSKEQISSLPNPGNDLTFIGQTTPGAVMNTQGGYGNFSSFGLPATANTFTVNGGYENDPFLNVNNSGATNLLLGNNDIGTVTVLSNAYGAQYGGLGGTQVNEITRSGGNQFHGDATYYWNGSVMNGNDYFNNQQGIKRPRSNANQWSGALGGPIVKDKTFFFFNTEGLRVIIPVRGTVYAPSANYIATTEANAAEQGPAAVAFYKSYFGVYTAIPAYATAAADPNDPNVVIFGANAANFAHEAQYTGRIDQVVSSKDNAFVHFTYDTGVQPTFTSLLNPVFNTDSPQPQYEGQFNETHIFNSNTTNQFVAADIYYQAVFQNTTAAAANAIFPASIIFISGDLANNGLAETPGGEDFAFPQGRKVNGYQFADDFSMTHGKHTFKAGIYLRRDNVTDLSPQILTTPLVESYETDFEAATASVYIQQFPTRSEQPVSVYNLGIYFQDEWKPIPSLVVTAGMRFEHNSNPVCHTGCFDTFPGSFYSESTSQSTPYSNANGKGLINSGEQKAFQDFEKVGYEPRLDFAWTPPVLGSKTVVRGGFGIFADAFPAQIADTLLNNAPTNVGFTLFGPAAGGPASPLYAGAPGSFYSVASGSSAAFQSAYNSGGSFTTISTAVPAFSAPNFASPAAKMSYPTYEEWNLMVEQQVGRTTTFGINYVGNHTYHQPVNNNSVNAYNAGGATGFPALSATGAPNPNFAQVTQVYSGAMSNYNGLVFTATKRSTLLTLQFNYTYSHALDEISNGGFDGFSSNSVNPTNPNPALLRQNYGNSDYDTRNYISSNYVFNLPYWGGPKVLTKGWQIAGTVFHSSGLPFTFTNGATAGKLANYGGPLYAKQTVANLPNKCSGSNIENLNTGTGTQCAAALDVTTATDFGQQRRNQVFGPSYTDTDMSVYKIFDIPKYQTAHLKLGVQFFNLLNHPNFAQPSHDIADGGVDGLISGTVNPPTSILGSFLGGDASPRLIQLKANISF
jgi:hypothetical protein